MESERRNERSHKKKTQERNARVCLLTNSSSCFFFFFSSSERAFLFSAGAEEAALSAMVELKNGQVKNQTFSSQLSVTKRLTPKPLFALMTSVAAFEQRRCHMEIVHVFHYNTNAAKKKKKRSALVHQNSQGRSHS